MTQEEIDFKDNLEHIMQNKEKYAILDTETTGLGKNDEIIEISILGLDGTVLLDTYVKPSIPVSKGAYDVHKIENSTLENAPSWPEVWPQVEVVLKGKRLIAYNAKFDVRMIQQSCKNHNIEEPFLRYLCMMELVMEWKGFRPKLEHFASGTQEHRALADCKIILEDIILKNL